MFLSKQPITLPPLTDITQCHTKFNYDQTANSLSIVYFQQILKAKLPDTLHHSPQCEFHSQIH